MKMPSDKTRAAAARRVLNYKPILLNSANGFVKVDDDNYLIASQYCAALLKKEFLPNGVLENTNDASAFVKMALGVIDITEKNYENEITDCVPELKQIKEYRKNVKKQHVYKTEIPMFIKNDFVNTKYLMDMLTLLPGAQVFANGTCHYKPLFFQSVAGKGVLLPINPAKPYDRFVKEYPGLNQPQNIREVFGK